MNFDLDAFLLNCQQDDELTLPSFEFNDPSTNQLYLPDLSDFPLEDQSNDPFIKPQFSTAEANFGSWDWEGTLECPVAKTNNESEESTQLRVPESFLEEELIECRRLKDQLEELVKKGEEQVEKMEEVVKDMKDQKAKTEEVAISMRNEAKSVTEGIVSRFKTEIETYCGMLKTWATAVQLRVENAKE
ncbi:hypothetical protein V2G26_007202 [Clonostachys chloroleuca]|uniref:Uncharacterized protein n=1 Tax=Clonostachys chloroleuca TaxID=1926264 RepID=A0AA35M364_9HYPO|nr:unnamed protein product [Clonostachys chloroleuca]CAI6089252.1 unnamed protein product [Clonostachys chloroleuca]CAI6089253.1 unnamed protein product [Clonostachys chloroleuca]CAI6089254.1 unnamed protein product [Clonostachys chloroleuca]